MRKMLILILTLLLWGCGARHSHTPEAAWDRDALQHWHGCSCGEKTDAQNHTMDENGVCTVCGATVQITDDVAQVLDFDGKGNLIRRTQFTADGETMDTRLTYTIDENGTYASAVVSTGSFGDGSHRREEELDCYGNSVAVRSYDADGNLLWMTQMEYVRVGEDAFRCVRSTGYSGEDGTTTITTFDEEDRIASVQQLDRSGNVVENIRYEREFDGEGNLLRMQEFDGDRLTRETVFDYWESGGTKIFYIHTSTVYRPDGTKTVTTYNKYEEIVSTVTYDAEGNPTS